MANDTRERDRSGGDLLVRSQFTDDEGKMWAVLVPEDQIDTPELGFIIGPPDVSVLGLPSEISVRLHNQLFTRNLLSKADLRGQNQQVYAALHAAFRLDFASVTSLYQ